MEENNNGMKVIILENDSVKMSEINNAKIIRIKDKNYNILIMKDYWPVLGEVDGSVQIEAEESLILNGIKGFYSLSHNVFDLIIREKENNND